MILGIDPGITGCLAILNKDGSYESHLAMPSVVHGTKKKVNAAAVMEFMRPYSGLINHAYIEQVNAMPKQGVTSMFSFGYSAGMMEMMLYALEIPHSFITPQAWKKSQGFTGKDKDAPRGRALQLYPQVRDLNLKGKGQALSDAVFIARHGMKLL